MEWVGDWPVDPGDDEILARAAQSNQVVVTLDKDFGELAVAFGATHAGIIRLVDLRSLEQAPMRRSFIRAIKIPPRKYRRRFASGPPTRSS